MTDSTEKPGTKPIPWAMLAVLYAISVAAGLLPYAWLIRSPLFLIGIFCLVAVVAALSLRARPEHTGESPNRWEIALGLLGYSAGGAICALVGMGIYVAFYWIFRLFGWLDLAQPSDIWASYVSAALTAMFVLSIASSDASELAKKMYPDRAGQKSPYYAFAQQRPRLLSLAIRLIVAVLAVSLGFVLVYFMPGFSNYFPAVLSVFLIVVSSELWGIRSLDWPSAVDDPALSRTTDLLEAAGYRVVAHPRTGDAEADSIVSILDFLALRSDHALAGRVIAAGRRAAPGILEEAGRLEPATWVLEDHLRDQKVTLHVEPVLIVSGDEAPGPERTSSSVELQRSSDERRKSVRIIQLPPESLLRAIFDSKNTGLIEKLATDLFGPPTTQPSMPARPPLATPAL